MPQDKPQQLRERDSPRPDGMRRLWGRRQAFRLRARQQALVESLLPRIRIARPGDAPAGCVDPARFFAPVKPEAMSLEIGFGGGEHLCDWAARHPEQGFIGAEPFINGMAKMLAHIDDAGIANIRLFAGDARLLIEALKEASFARVFVLFPDPWPKKRHYKRRFVQDETLNEIARVLKDDGVLRIASDIPDYIGWTLEHIARRPEFVWTAERAEDWRSRPGDWPQTRYEQKAIREGRSPAYLEFIRLPRT